MTQAIAGTGNGQANPQQPAPGSAFGMPKYGTQRRFVLDAGNQALAAVPLSGAQVNVPTTKLDQLDIVVGQKINVQYGGTWTNTGAGLAVSPFFPANIFQQITYKLQAAYNTFNLPGPLAAMIQSFRPMWGNRQTANLTPDPFASVGLTAGKPTFGSAFTKNYNIDIPFAWKFDEYFDLDSSGNPQRQLYDQIVTPMFMAAQARVVVPTITLAPQLSTNDLLGAPVSRPGTDTTSTYTAASFAAQVERDAFWTANSPAANPPQFPWLYTRDYFTQPTSGQGAVNCLIQNTGVSVGQVLALWGFVWDPAANSGLGAVVPYTSIQSFQLVTGGSLQNEFDSAQSMQDRLSTEYGWFSGPSEAQMPPGVFVYDKMLKPDGGYHSNADAINTYLVNGVSVIITFRAGLVPSASATVYMGVEALKLATS